MQDDFLRSVLRRSIRLAAPLFVSLVVSGAQTHQQRTTSARSRAKQRPRTQVVPAASAPKWRLPLSTRLLILLWAGRGRGREGGESEGLEPGDGGCGWRQDRCCCPQRTKGMPRFDFSDQQIASLMAFIHIQQNNALTRGRRGVDVSNLQTGNVQAGRLNFSGVRGCATCHPKNYL